MGRMRQWGTSAFKDSKGMYYKNEKGHLLESVVFLQDPVVEAGIMKSLQATAGACFQSSKKGFDSGRHGFESMKSYIKIKNTTSDHF